MSTTTTPSIYTLEARNAYREKCMKRFGMECAIPEAVADEIREIVKQGWVVNDEKFHGPTLNFSVYPRRDVSMRKRMDIETMLSKVYGNAPYSFSTRFTTYQMTFHVN